jgi:hypothetical protein
MINFNNSLTMTSFDSASTSKCEHIEKTIKLLNTTVPILWLVIGTITNCLCLFVFAQSSMRRNSTFTYFTLMSLSDLIVLWLTSFRDFLVYKFEFFIVGTQACRLHVFIFFLSCQFSSWLLTAANMDRLIYVICHTRAKKYCTRRMAFKIAGIILFCLVLMNCHFLYFVYSDDNGLTSLNSSPSTTTTKDSNIHPIVYPYCKTKPGSYTIFYTNYYSWMDAFVFSFIPFIIMLICNVNLIIKVFSTKRNLKKRIKSNKLANKLNANNVKQEAIAFDLNTNNKSNMLNVNNEEVKFPMLKRSSMPAVMRHVSIMANCPNSPQNQHMNKIHTLSIATGGGASPGDRMRNMAITIIGCTLLFIIFTLPINIYVPISHSAAFQNDDKEEKCDDLVFSILNNMVNANHSINFFIYILTNTKFRQEIFNLLFKLRVDFDSLTQKCGFRIECVQNSPKSSNSKSNKSKQQQQINFPITKIEKEKSQLSRKKSSCLNTNERSSIISSSELEKHQDRNNIKYDAKLGEEIHLSINCTSSNHSSSSPSRNQKFKENGRKTISDNNSRRFDSI